MEFKRIDKESWKRKEYYDYYFETIPATYSMGAKLDITRIIEKKLKIYPVLLYLVTKTVNKYEEFRTIIDDGELGIFSEMTPSYTIFNKESETFSSIWTEYSSNFELFYERCIKDIEIYSTKQGLYPKGEPPKNCFPVSMIPWVIFESFNLNLQKGYGYLLPIFTLGRYYKECEKIFIPLSIQVHHAVCDGFHITRFINSLQESINSF